MFRIWKEASASKKDAIAFLGFFLVVAVVGGAWWTLAHIQPDAPSWKTQMAQDSGIVNGATIPLIVVETFDDAGESTFPQPSLLILQQEFVLSERDAKLVYIAPDGRQTEVLVPTHSFTFVDSHGADPTSRFHMLAWRSDTSLQSNIDAFLGSITVNQSPLDFTSYVAGWS